MRDEARQNILCVDDDEVVRCHLQSCLEEEFNVQCAEDGRGGLETLARGGVDWVILDYMLPDMTGGRFVITADKLGLHPNYLLLSSLELGPVRDTGLVDMGIQGSLEKPVDPGLLRRMLSRPVTDTHRNGRVEVGDYIAWIHSVERRSDKETRGLR